MLPSWRYGKAFEKFASSTSSFMTNYLPLEFQQSVKLFWQCISHLVLAIEGSLKIRKRNMNRKCGWYVRPVYIICTWYLTTCFFIFFYDYTIHRSGLLVIHTLLFLSMIWILRLILNINFPICSICYPVCSFLEFSSQYISLVYLNVECACIHMNV